MIFLFYEDTFGPHEGDLSCEKLTQSDAEEGGSTSWKEKIIQRKC